MSLFLAAVFKAHGRLLKHAVDTFVSLCSLPGVLEAVVADAVMSDRVLRQLCFDNAIEAPALLELPNCWLAAGRQWSYCG